MPNYGSPIGNYNCINIRISMFFLKKLFAIKNVAPICSVKKNEHMRVLGDATKLTLGWGSASRESVYNVAGEYRRSDSARN